MIIKDIQINGFGNLENKNYQLKKGINVITGNNESGKSTLIEFIKGILYGVSKTKDGKKFSDTEKLKPWKNIEFSGKMSYIKEDKEYTVYREFNKNNAKIYDNEGNELKDLFNKDKSRGAEIGFGHLGMDEETFENSVLIKQGGIKVTENSQKNIIQKITNMIESGEESISYEKTREKLEKMIVDEIGTERTQNKPKNIIKRGIIENETARENLIYKKEKEDKLNQEIKNIEKKKKQIEDEKEEIEKVLKIREKYEKQLIEKRETFEISQKIFEKQKSENEKKKSKKHKEDILVIIIVTIILTALCVFLKEYMIAAVAIILGIIGIIVYQKYEKNKELEEIMPNFDITIEELKKKEKREIKSLEEEGIKKSLFERKASELKILQNGLEAKKNDLILEEHKINIELDSLKSGINRLNEIEENLSYLYSEKKSLEKLENTIKLAIRVLDDSYAELKSEVIPRIEEEIKENIEKTTNGNYKTIKYNDNQGLIAENTNGEIITIDKLSVGTIDQMYLGFRLSIASKYNKVPIIFDETFAFCDDERLENILKTLEIISKENQIIILSCSDREEKLLEKQNIKYNKISM